MSTPYEKMIAAYAKRTDQMRRLRASGWTLERIAARYGIKRQRVHKILDGNGKARP